MDNFYLQRQNFQTTFTKQVIHFETLEMIAIQCAIEGIEIFWGGG